MFHGNLQGCIYLDPPKHIGEAPTDTRCLGQQEHHEITGQWEYIFQYHMEETNLRSLEAAPTNLPATVGVFPVKGRIRFSDLNNCFQG